MTEQKHTKGPWGIEKTTKTLWIGPLRNDGKIAVITCSVDWCDEYHDYAKERDEANARRIVSCVNACEELEQDALDGGWNAKGVSDYAKAVEAERDTLAAKVKELEAQRDELLAALNVAASAIDIAADWNLPAVQVDPPPEWKIDNGGEEDSSWASTRGLAEYFSKLIAKIEAEKSS